MHVKVTYLFDNAATVFFAVFMSFWGVYATLDGCLCHHPSSPNHFWPQIRLIVASNSPDYGLEFAFDCGPKCNF